MALTFKRKKRLEIDYIEQNIQRFAYVVDFKGPNIDRDEIALCYLRACKEVLLFYIGTGQWSRKPTRDKEKESRMPYIVYDRENEPVTMTRLLKFEEEIHRAAEDLHAFYNAQRRTHGQSVLDCGWRFRSGG